MVPLRSARPRGRVLRATLNPLLFSVIVPTRGEPEKLRHLISALEDQTFPGERFEVFLSFDGTAPDAPLATEISKRGWRVIAELPRRGPGAARNRAAREARGEYLAFTEDDCSPHATWLEHAAIRLEGDRSVDVLAGDTVLPDGTPARRPGSLPHYLPTNLFVRRSLFERVGGYHEEFFDERSGVYFREDSDLGFTLEEAGARVETDRSTRVVHPHEHPDVLDPIRWARRYEMDVLLRKRHPARFRERIEVLRLGPLTLRRPFVRACYAVVTATLSAALAWCFGEDGLAALLGLVAIAAFLPVWAKWRFDPLRLPVVLSVPWVLVLAQIRGAIRFRATRKTASTH